MMLQQRIGYMKLVTCMKHEAEVSLAPKMAWHTVSGNRSTSRLSLMLPCTGVLGDVQDVPKISFKGQWKSSHSTSPEEDMQQIQDPD